MSLRTDEIFELLPTFLRLRDAEQGQRLKGRVAEARDTRDAEDFGPLRTLASLIAREGQIVDEGLRQLYDDAFIETCAPWAIAYIGDLLGVRGLADIPEGIDMRARVANTLELRSRKGTLRALEHASADASGWPVHAVEYWKKLVHMQSMRLTHPGMGESIDLRDKPALARLGSAFERSARSVDVRRIDTAGGRWNLGNIGLHVWRLRPASITSHLVRPIAGLRHFRFHPLGCDAQLYAPTGLRGGVSEPAREADMPAPISRAIMAEDESRFFGPGKAMQIRVGATLLDGADIKAANLASLPAPGPGEAPWNRAAGISGVTLVDPELGRIIVDPDLAGPVRVTCHFARTLEIGGGEHARDATIGSIEDATTLAASTNLVTAINGGDPFGTFLLDQTTRYTASGTIDVPAGEVLRLIATDTHFPTVFLGPGGLTITLGDDARLELNGLRLAGGELVVTGTGSGVALRDCTIVPGRSIDSAGNPTAPGSPALRVQTPGASLVAERCILGPAIVAGDVDARFEECVLDAGAADNMAFSMQAGAERVSLALDRCTVLGRVATSFFADGARGTGEQIGVEITADERLASADTIFAGRTGPAVLADYRQIGCIRFSYVPAASQTPRLYRCVSSPEPQFESTRYVDAQYMALSSSVGDAILRGAENGGEMGAYNRAANQARHDNIRRSIDDFLRFGHAAGIFHET